MPEPVIIHNRPFWARLFGLFWVVEIIMGLLFARIGFGWIGPGENGMAIILAVMGLLLAAAGVVMAGLCWRIARISGPAIEMGSAGLTDRRLSAVTVPWESLTWKILFNGRSHSLYFAVADPVRRRLKPYWPQRAMGLFNRMLHHPEFTVVTLGTGLSAREIAARMEAFKPPAS